MAPRDEPDDHDLLHGIARGESVALERLVQRHSEWAFRLLQRLLGQPAVAEDILQTCFVQLWERPPAWQPQAQFKTWFYRVLHNRCMDHFRRESRWAQPSVGHAAPDALDGPSAGAESDLQGPLSPAQPGLEQTVMQRLDVQAALQALPERQRMAIVWVYFEELPQAQAAELMEISVGALESLLSRARVSLSRHLAAHRH